MRSALRLDFLHFGRTEAKDCASETGSRSRSRAGRAAAGRNAGRRVRTRLAALAATVEATRATRIGWLAPPALTLAAGSLGIALGVAQLHQWLLALAVFPWLLLDARAGDARRALGRLLLWAAAATVLTLAWTLAAPQRTGALLDDGGFHHADTLAFVREGKGELARPADFTTDHALDYAYVTAGSAFGAGLAPLLMAARRVTLVAHEWGLLLRDGGYAPRIWLLGLPAWSVVGALGYGLLLVGWAEVTGAWLGRRRVRWRLLGRAVALGTALLALHLWWHVALPGTWADWLAPVLSR